MPVRSDSDDSDHTQARLPVKAQWPNAARGQWIPGICPCQGLPPGHGRGALGLAPLALVLRALLGARPEDVAARFADAPAAEFKDALTAALVNTMGPIRRRLNHLTGEGRGEVESALREGAEAAREVAADTMREVRGRVGYA